MRTPVQHCEIHGLQNLLGVVAIAATTGHRPAEAVGVRPLELSSQLDIVHCTLLRFDVTEYGWRERRFHMTGDELCRRTIVTPRSVPADYRLVEAAHGTVQTLMPQISG